MVVGGSDVVLELGSDVVVLGSGVVVVVLGSGVVVLALGPDVPVVAPTVVVTRYTVVELDGRSPDVAAVETSDVTDAPEALGQFPAAVVDDVIVASGGSRQAAEQSKRHSKREVLNRHSSAHCSRQIRVMLELPVVEVVMVPVVDDDVVLMMGGGVGDDDDDDDDEFPPVLLPELPPMLMPELLPVLAPVTLPVTFPSLVYCSDELSLEEAVPLQGGVYVFTIPQQWKYT